MTPPVPESASGQSCNRDRSQAALVQRYRSCLAQIPLCTHILEHLEFLFVYVTDSHMPLVNNAAKWHRRYLETIRKISGGHRAVLGNRNSNGIGHIVWRWGIDPVETCYQLLASPQV